MKDLDHIGIAVSNLEQAQALFARLLGRAAYHRETVAAAGVEVAFFKAGEVKIELIAPLGTASPVHSFLARRGEGLHHLAFRVEDLAAACSHMQSAGFKPLGDKAQKGAENKQIRFFHPKNIHGVLIELCQEARPTHTTSKHT